MSLKWSSSSVINVKCLLVIRQPSLYPKHFTLFSTSDPWDTLQCRHPLMSRISHFDVLFHKKRKCSTAATLHIDRDINIMLQKCHESLELPFPSDISLVAIYLYMRYRRSFFIDLSEKKKTIIGIKTYWEFQSQLKNCNGGIKRRSKV